MAKLWARAGISFEIADDRLAEVKRLLQSGQVCEAQEILSDAMLGTYEFVGENYIPDNDDCIAGVDELRDFDF